MMQRSLMAIIVTLLMLGSVPVLLGASAENTRASTLYVSPAGSTYTTIQDAINAASGGDTIVVAPATYNENVIIPTDVHLIGNDSALCVLDGGASVAMAVNTNTALVMVEDLNITTSGAAANGVECTNGGNLDLENCIINVTGVGASPLSVDSSHVDMHGCDVDLYRKVIKSVGAPGNVGTVTCFDMDIKPVNVDLDANSVVDVYFTSTIRVLYEDSMTPVEGADVNITVEGYQDHWANYRSAYYGGMAERTNASGYISSYLLSGTYTMGSVDWSYNIIKVYKNLTYGTGILEREETRNVSDVNESQSIEVTLGTDIRAPGIVENVSVSTIDHTSLNITWSDSTEPDHHNYTVYRTDAAGSYREFLGNTTLNFTVDTGREPATRYFYMVTQWDASMLESEASAIVSNITATPPYAIVKGTALFASEPARGVEPRNLSAVVELMDHSGAIIRSQLINTTAYNFSFDAIPFQINVTLRAVPNASVAGVVGVCSGWLTNSTDNFELNETSWSYDVDLVMEYLVCDPFRDITGNVIYTGGPLDGQIAVNATVTLFNGTGVRITNTTCDAAGAYNLSGIPNNRAYYLQVSPAAGLEGSEDTTGYLINITSTFDLLDDMSVDIHLEYFIYVPPASLNITFRAPTGTNVSVDGNITIGFDHEMNTTSAGDTIGIAPAVGNLTFVWNALNTTVSVTHLPFLYNTTYTVTIDPALTSLHGYAFPAAFTGNVWNFTTEMQSSVTPFLNVISEKPDGSSVRLDRDIEFVLDHEVSPTAFSSAFSITPDVTGKVFTWDAANMTMRITHDEFAAATGYTMVISHDLVSVEGYGFEVSGELTFNFTTTATTSDHVSITITSPTGGEFEPGEMVTVSGTTIGVPDGTNITVSVGGNAHVTSTVTDGNWSVAITMPDGEGVYAINAESSGVSDSVQVSVKKASGSETDQTLMYALIAVAVILVVMGVILGVFFMMKRSGSTGEDLEGEDVEDEDVEDEDLEDEDLEDEDLEDEDLEDEELEDEELEDEDLEDEELEDEDLEDEELEDEDLEDEDLEDENVEDEDLEDEELEDEDLEDEELEDEEE